MLKRLEKFLPRILTEKEILPIEVASENINPLDWWVYKNTGPGIRRPEKYLKPPVCGEAETYYLLYFLKLLEVLNTTGKILQGNLFEVTVYSFDHSKYTKALAIKKQDLFDIKSNQYFSMGEQTFLIINSNLAGTLGKSVDWTPQYENTVSVKAIRPLMPSSTQTIQDIKSVISQTGIAFDHFSLEQAILFQTAFDELQKQLLLDIIISASHTLELPINEAAFRKNTAIPKYRTP